ncbi:MAG: hypothetical protein R3E32_19240 [Chitinophagales bacterium]
MLILFLQIKIPNSEASPLQNWVFITFSLSHFSPPTNLLLPINRHLSNIRSRRFHRNPYITTRLTT